LFRGYPHSFRPWANICDHDRKNQQWGSRLLYCRRQTRAIADGDRQFIDWQGTNIRKRRDKLLCDYEVSGDQSICVDNLGRATSYTLTVSIK
jgi:hypothetical protein